MLRRAADLQDEIEARQNELNQLLTGKLNGSSYGSLNIVTKSGQKRRLSAEALDGIRKGQQKRWAEHRRLQREAAKAAEAAQAATAPVVATPVAPAPRGKRQSPPVPTGSVVKTAPVEGEVKTVAAAPEPVAAAA